MINEGFKNIDEDYSNFEEKNNVSKLIKKKCIETLKVSREISNYIKKLHEFLILPEIEGFSSESVKSEDFLNKYTERLNSMISELLTKMNEQPEGTFFNLPKISSILIDIKDIIKRYHSEFDRPEINIQPVHQDLHMEQILYNKIDNQYNFYFIDFEGDPQLSLKEKRGKFPVEKDLATFLRALSYIKFNTLLRFIEKNIIQKDKYEVPEEILYNLFFRRAAKPLNKILDIVLNVLNIWESKLMSRILKDLDVDYTLITYFYIEKALYELRYEILFRPNKIIVPILGLKEIVDKR
jgi:predicted trehalose synthase